MPEGIDAELYCKYRDQVLSLSTARQRMEGQTMIGAFSDREIASKLGLKEDQVREIRCMAELDGISLDSYPEAEEFKRQRARRTRR